MTKNRLRTSYESSLKPSDFTLQRGALRFQLPAKNSGLACEIMFFCNYWGFFAKSPTVRPFDEQN